MESQLASTFLPLMIILAWLPMGTVSQPEEADMVMECKFRVCLENFTVHAKCQKPAGLGVKNQTNATALGENTANLTSPGMDADNMGICKCMVFIPGVNSTDTANTTQGCGPQAPQTNVTEKKTWAELNCLLCIIFGLTVGTLLYMPTIGILLWKHRRNRKGKLASMQAVEGNQPSMAAPGTGTEDLTYANLKFEKKGTKSTSSNIIYTEIKPPQPRPSSEDAGAASTGVDVSPEGEGI